MDHTESTAEPQQVITLQYRVSGRDSHLSFLFFFQEIGVFNTLLTSTFSQCILKNISKCIPLCFILYLLSSYEFYLFLLLYLKNNQKELCHSTMTKLVACFLAKSGLVFPSPYPKVGGQVWHFSHSRRRPSPRSQLCT